ncbi:GDP-L-fucose synthase [Aldersonia sp. NBC_00410]|uniref:GDP-L-fucose synthase family protein n=1 Tax=Aldersonia sp. NBC_00410 TaxID=2975954 RepID=UPI00224C88CB|nr:GDP-L-fucose synthase [Aldersonia sp. NBC_00410]MCX5041686.1 GDP-L-fucose synthase [Aldersonia sp. NBC_00410]
MDGVVAQHLTQDTRIFIAGHRGLVGAALWRHFAARGYDALIGAGSREVDLRDPGATRDFLERTRPQVVIDAAARTGGIAANMTRPVDFLSDNLRIQLNLLDSAVSVGVDRLLFLGSSCIYPKFADQPISEDALLTGPLEPTNEAYAMAKIAGIMHVRSIRRQYGLRYISAMPTNVYGPGDNFNPHDSHVLPAMIRRFYDAARGGAESVTCWGSGTPRREFLHADDLAAACHHLLDHYDDERPINIGTGTDCSIAELASMVADAAGFEGVIRWDDSRPDGTPRKLIDIVRLTELGWTAKIGLADGLKSTYEWFVDHQDDYRT